MWEGKSDRELEVISQQLSGDWEGGPYFSENLLSLSWDRQLGVGKLPKRWECLPGTV